ncbi:MAG TPA: hypothetical protein VK922_14390 [Gemmatimonadaceae bacterium]|nr:hypothetical protein [Gemmatimonadaceae bacterium]
MIDDRHERDLSTADLAAAAHRDERVPERDGEHRLHDREIATRPVREDADDRQQTEPPLLASDVVNGYRRRWMEVQTGFVDEPRRAVEEADGLVAEAIRELAESFASERATLERQWDRGDDVSTEDLRQALQRYRAFFGRLLSV